MAVGRASRLRASASSRASASAEFASQSTNPFAQLFAEDDAEEVTAPEPPSVAMALQQKPKNLHVSPPTAASAVDTRPTPSKNDAPLRDAYGEEHYGPPPCHCSGGARNGRSSSKNAKKHEKAKEKKRRNQELAQQSDSIEASAPSSCRR